MNQPADTVIAAPSRRFRGPWVCAWLCSLALVACGGGDDTDAGGSDGGSFGATTQVTITPDQLLASWPDRENRQFGMTATVQPLPAGTLYPSMTADQPVLLNSATTIQQQSTGIFAITVYSLPGLPAGHYSGTMTFHLCKDPACADEHPLNGATVRYDFLVEAT